MKLQGHLCMDKYNSYQNYTQKRGGGGQRETIDLKLVKALSSYMYQK